MTWEVHSIKYESEEQFLEIVKNFFEKFPTTELTTVRNTKTDEWLLIGYGDDKTKRQADAISSLLNQMGS